MGEQVIDALTSLSGGAVALERHRHLMASRVAQRVDRHAIVTVASQAVSALRSGSRKNSSRKRRSDRPVDRPQAHAVAQAF